MNLTDKEILELGALCDAIIDGTLTEKQQARLSRWLAGSDEARRYYVRVMALSASLYTYASEMQVEAPDEGVLAKILHLGSSWGLGLVAAAASVMFALWLFSMKTPHGAAAVKMQSEEFVARLTGSRESQ